MNLIIAIIKSWVILVVIKIISNSNKENNKNRLINRSVNK